MTDMLLGIGLFMLYFALPVGITIGLSVSWVSDFVSKKYPTTDIVEVEKREKLTVDQKAVLIELAKAHQSPAYRGGWNTTHYDTLGIEFNRWGGSWDLRFKYNSSGGYGYRTDGMLLPWKVDAKTLPDVFQHYIGLATLAHTPHADSYYNTHK